MFNPLRDCRDVSFIYPRFRKLHRGLFKFNHFVVRMGFCHCLPPVPQATPGVISFADLRFMFNHFVVMMCFVNKVNKVETQ